MRRRPSRAARSGLAAMLLFQAEDGIRDIGVTGVQTCALPIFGYVRGVLKGDRDNSFVINASGETVTLPRGSSDAALGPYHVERSKIFVAERLGRSPIIDADRVARAIECTRFPVYHDREHGPDDLEGRLVQGADLIGQLGDPLYLKKANALYYEFEEIGLNRQLGYATPADLVERYPDFYWTSVSPHIKEAVGHLNVTRSQERRVGK